VDAHLGPGFGGAEGCSHLPHRLAQEEPHHEGRVVGAFQLIQGLVQGVQNGLFSRPWGRPKVDSTEDEGRGFPADRALTKGQAA
jgi:hypothetical protein